MSEKRKGGHGHRFGIKGLRKRTSTPVRCPKTGYLTTVYRTPGGGPDRVSLKDISWNVYEREDGPVSFSGCLFETVRD